MKGPPEKPLGLDMPFGEALRRFIGTDPTELPSSSILVRKKGKAPKKPPPVGEKEADPKEPLD